MDNSNALAAIAQRVDTSEFARRLVERFREEIDGYRRLPEPVVLGEILEISEKNLELFFSTIVDRREVEDADFEPFRESARNRAAEGMPLEDLLHAYRLGGRLGWQMVVESAEPEEQSALLDGATRVMEYIDRVSSAVAQTYMEERQLLVSEEERSLRLLLDALCADGPIGSQLLEVAERIGFPLEGEYRPFSQTGQGAPARDHSQFARRLRTHSILALTEGDRVTGLAPLDVDIPRVRHERGLIALGEPTPRAELREALDDVRLLLDMGCRMKRVGEITTQTFLPELLLARSPRIATQLHERVLGPLEDREGRSPDLLETLDVFVAAGLDRRLAADHLHVHPNTLNYRLKRVEELTGLELSSPHDLMLMALALRYRASSLRRLYRRTTWAPEFQTSA